jgi:hypothetical protein
VWCRCIHKLVHGLKQLGFDLGHCKATQTNQVSFCVRSASARRWRARRR